MSQSALCDRAPDTSDLEQAIHHGAAGNHAAAVEACLAALTKDIGCAQGWKLLGDNLRAVGKQDNARGAYHRALERCFSYPDAWFALATLLVEMGEFGEAHKALGETVRQQPDCHVARLLRAALHLNSGQDDAALDELRLVLDVIPAHIEALVLSARIHLRRQTFDAGLIACRTALLHAPDHAGAHVVLGAMHYRLGHTIEALALLERAVLLAPDFAEARHDLGVLLKALGRFDAARTHFREGLRLDPNMFGGFLNIADLVDFAQEPKLVAQIERHLECQCGKNTPDAQETRDTRMRLHFAAAKVREDLGDYPGALDHYREGGRLKRATVHYDDGEHAAHCMAIKTAFSRDFMANHGLVGDPSRAPVFIVGMPRSGSTLVEQILSCHPRVKSLGEVMALPAVLAQCTDRFPELRGYPQFACALQQHHVAAMAKAYLNQVGGTNGPSVRTTDKLLNNFFEIGLIHILFPHAKIIHTRRDPMATCVSAFRALFADKLWYSYDMAELGANYCHYVDLMEHWNTVLPEGVITTIAYEDVVTDIQASARRLLRFVDLPWDDACLDFNTSQRVVQTASIMQVRKPIYRSAIDSWRRYGPGLAPLIEALRPSIGRPGGLIEA